MGTQRFTPEFKEEAVRQITERPIPLPTFQNDLGFQHTVFINGCVQ